ncbi:flap endonuclease-1 [Ferroplasma acidiphilum]|uniref:Flap endonuclease 1 n=1 Tax=Ferroplasma acidiphilum TaxID=74969 RepID=A0A7K4FJY8_9ARCH|nr:flap endonuclease-1 [Ferroplasma acidiphilum]NOL59360.1 flap endonuclease-1 [Ferroplasma acidiphilum]
MGVDISGILVKHQTSIRENGGITVSIDAFNIIYQFLSSIRGEDGEPLKDEHGNITSHLSGIFYRTATLLENNIKPVYSFDGKPYRLKDETLKERKAIKEKNIAELNLAMENKDAEKIKTLSSRINYITADIVSESKKLLDMMGVPWVQAPSEGEAQASYMSKVGAVDSVISQDYDCLLLGARRVLRNFTMYGRRRISGTGKFINITPEIIDLKENLDNLGITQDQLIGIGILVGTDFNPGIRGIGAKTGLSLIKKYGDIESVLKQKNKTIDNLDEIKEFFLNPPVEDTGELKFAPPYREKIIEYLCAEHSFSENRINSILDRIEKNYSGVNQSSLDKYF